MMDKLIEGLRTRLKDLDITNQAFNDDYLRRTLNSALEESGYELPLETSQHEQLIIIEAAIIILQSLKMWADGESYSYKTEAVQVTRGLMSRHYKDTIELLQRKRNNLVEGLGGVY